MLRPSTAFLLVLVAASPVSAHVNETQAGKLAYFDEAGTFLGGGTSWGIVFEADGGDGYARVCEEAYSFPAVIPPSFSHLRSDGSVLLGGFAGAFISREQGCTYDPVADLDRKIASALGVGPGGRLFVSTANIGLANGVLSSDDEGETWSELLPPVADRSFFQLVTSGARILLTGHTASGGPTVPAVWVSEDAGESFTDVSAAYAGFPLVRAATFDGDDALFGGFGGQGGGHVLRAAPPYDAFVQERVEDGAGGAASFPSEVTNIAVLPADGSIVALSRQAGVLFHQPPGGAFVQVANFETGPTDCVFTKPDGSGLIGCGKEATGSLGLYMESVDGLTWTSLIDFEDVSYRRCDAASEGGIACASQYESDCSDNIDNDGDQDFDCDDSECGDVCGGEGEGEGPAEGEGEGEGDDEPSEGEGEGEGGGGDTGSCASMHSEVTFAMLGALLLRRRRSLRGKRRRVA